MSHLIVKFRLAANAIVKNSICGDEPALENILRAAKNAGVPKKNIRDRSNRTKLEIDVILQSDAERTIFKTACGVDPSRICNG